MGEQLTFAIRELNGADRTWIVEFLNPGGADFIVSCGRKLYPHKLPGYMAVTPEGERVGFVTCEIIGDQCEVVTLDALRQWSGIGSALLGKVAETAREAGCTRLWLMTTNDNIDAIRFYQRRGMRLAGINAGAIKQSREIKPAIPEIGTYRIPIRDEVLFEMDL